MKIIRCIAGLIGIFSLLTFPSCHKSDPAVILGNWVTSTDFAGSPRSGAYCFVIGAKAYVGLGYGGPNNIYLPDSYVFDSGNTTWIKIADFPGTLREQSVAFSVNGKGYVGTGYNRELATVQLKDFWEYDPASNQWKQLNDFGGDARYNAVAFDDGTYGYVGTGYNGNFYSDFWQYNPSDDSWKVTTPTPKKREQSMIMTINNKIYLCGGSNNGAPIYDLWQFDPATQLWSNQTPLTTDAQYANFKLAVNRYSGVAFTLDNKGYLATGLGGGVSQTTVYQYDPGALTWTKMTPYEGAARSYSVAFVVGGKAYLTTGQNGTFHFDDMKEFRPLEEYNIND